MKVWYLATMRGIGQIMLQKSAWTGGIFLLGLSLVSWTMGVSALLASFIGTVTAHVFRFDRMAWEEGIFGFSAALVGVALVLFIQDAWFAFALIMPGAVIAAWLQHVFLKHKVPAFTLPFVLVTWSFILVLRHLNPESLAVLEPLSTQEGSLALAPLRGFGQVIFQDVWWIGGLFFIGVLIQAPIAALYGLMASMIMGLFALGLDLGVTSVALGLWGYNAVLCAIVFAGKRPKDAVWVIIISLLALAIQWGMLQSEIPVLTFPFVLASGFGVYMKKATQKIEQRAKMKA